MTVQKTYECLKNDGYIEIDRRSGARIKPKADLPELFIKRVEDELTLLISESSLKGINFYDFMKICADIYGELKLSYADGT